MADNFVFRAGGAGRQVDAGTRVTAYSLHPEVLDVVELILDGTHAPEPNRRSALTYLIREGQVNFELEGHRVTAGPGDVVHVPARVRRSLSGTASMFLLAKPHFDPADEV